MVQTEKIALFVLHFNIHIELHLLNLKATAFVLQDFLMMISNKCVKHVIVLARSAKTITKMITVYHVILMEYILISFKIISSYSLCHHLTMQVLWDSAYNNVLIVKHQLVKHIFAIHVTKVA